MQVLFINMLPRDGKIKLAMAGVSKNGRKYWFPLARNQFPPARICSVFKKLVSNHISDSFR